MNNRTRHKRPSPRLVLAHAFVAVAVVMLVVGITGCRTPVTVTEHAEAYPIFAVMREELPPLGVLSADVSAEIPTIRRYYRDCTAGVPGARHEAGYVLLDGERMAVHVFLPPSLESSGESAEIVLLVHGYLSHALDHAPLISRFLAGGYAVVVPELPGHGLSGGVRGAITSFESYGVFLEEVLEGVRRSGLVAGSDESAWHAVAHSTGAVAIIEFLRHGRDPFNSIVFAAPLVRNRLYRGAWFGRAITRPIVTAVGTVYDSPLGVSQMPLSWFDAQVAWNRRLREVEPIDRPLLVLQGNRDRVVAWRHNRRALTTLVPEVEYRIIRGGSHILYQDDRDRYRELAIDLTVAYLRRSVEK